MSRAALEHVATVEAAVAGQTGKALSPEEPILLSWRRCLRSYGLKPSKSRDFAVYETGQLREIQDRFGSLCNVARTEMQNLYEQISGSGYALMLTDARGVIVDTLVDPGLTREFQEAGLWLGALWNEEHQGTNGIGTCLVEHRPVTIHKTDHFLGYNTGLTCTGAPVWDTDGTLLAVLDASSVNSRDTRAIQTHTLALVSMSAEIISKCRFLSEYSQSFILRFHSRGEFVGLLHEGLMAVGADGVITACNASALRQLGYADRQALIGHRICEAFDLDIDRMDELAYRDAGTICAIREVRHGRRFLCTVQAPMRQRHRSGPSPNTVRKHPELRLDSSLAGGDTLMQHNVQRAERVIDRGIPVLLTGATGTGKEAFARAMHQASARAHKPFVAINCASIPESLIESELFGYARGTFTGAAKEGKRGRIAQADGGTLFLDEIGDMPLELQTRLLRVLEEHEVVPLGGEEPVSVDLCVISATHRNIAAMVEAEEFREDLYYRLNGLTLTLPMLRDRDDRAQLIRSVLDEEQGQEHLHLDEQAFCRLMEYAWPGNIRQLRNVLRTAAALCNPPVIQLDDLPPELRDFRPGTAEHNEAASSEEMSDIQLTPLEQAERATLIKQLECHGRNVTRTATALDMSRNTLYRKMHKYGICPPR